MPAPNLREALRRARALGLRCWKLNRTGEVAVANRDGYRVVVNSRRKDAPRALLVLLRREEKP
jgi:hypothetical protein